MWKRAPEYPDNKLPVVCTYGGALFYAFMNDRETDEWIECEADGSTVFGRDGSVVYPSVTWWCQAPPVQ